MLNWTQLTWFFRAFFLGRWAQVVYLLKGVLNLGFGLPLFPLRGRLSPLLLVLFLLPLGVRLHYDEQ